MNSASRSKAKLGRIQSTGLRRHNTWYYYHVKPQFVGVKTADSLSDPLLISPAREKSKCLLAIDGLSGSWIGTRHENRLLGTHP
jgi:hypothetical protein